MKFEDVFMVTFVIVLLLGAYGDVVYLIDKHSTSTAALPTREGTVDDVRYTRNDDKR